MLLVVYENCGEKFNVVVTRHVIEHLLYSEIFKFFKYSYNVLSKNGTLVNTTPNAQNLIYNMLYEI